MNFQMCQQSAGKYLMLSGIATRYEIIDGQWGPYGLGSLRDSTGRTEDMMFASSDKSPLPPQSLLNIPCVYTVQWDANKQKFKAYFKSYANQQQMPNAYQAPRQASQNAQQPPQQPAQSTNQNNAVDLLTNIYGVLCRIQEIIEKETDFNKKYDLGEESVNPQEEQQVDDTDSAPW